MNILKKDIKERTFQRVYLLCGSDNYLKQLYKKKLKQAVLPDGNDMNYSYFEGEHIDIPQLSETLNTLPFFSEYRLIIVENSGLFKSANDLADAIPSMSDATVLIFVEESLDKRNRLYKAVKEAGYICELNGLEEKDLELFVGSFLQKHNLKISRDTVRYFISLCGSDMENMVQELTKLSSYADGKEAVSIADIDDICTPQITGKIFQMIDDIGQQRLSSALTLYQDLLSLKEPPLRILSLILRHFNLLLRIKSSPSASNAELAKKLKLPPFAVGKYQQQARHFSPGQIKDCIEYALLQEEHAKTGRISAQLAVELVIIRSANKPSKNA